MCRECAAVDVRREPSLVCRLPGACASADLVKLVIFALNPHTNALPVLSSLHIFEAFGVLLVKARLLTPAFRRPTRVSLSVKPWLRQLIYEV